jgi:hypothetical protein
MTCCHYRTWEAQMLVEYNIVTTNCPVYTNIVTHFKNSCEELPVPNSTKIWDNWGRDQMIRNWSKHICPPFINLSRDSAVGIATGYGLDSWGVGVPVPLGAKFLFSPRRPHRVWAPPSLLSNGYRGSFPGGKAAGSWSWPLTSNYCRGQEYVD